VTEGNGHVIDPNGDARRALHEAVAEHGPEALSNAVIMDNVCRDHLSSLPGESILIGSAARIDVPALLRNLIPRLGNYGAIQSAAVTLAEEHKLDLPACVWVVREFARALGHIAPRPATGGPGSWPGLGSRPASGESPRPVPGPAPVSTPHEPTAQLGVAPAGAGEGSPAAEAAAGAASTGPASTGPASSEPRGGGPEGPWGGPPPGGAPWGGPGGGGGGSPGGPGLPPQGPGGTGASPPGGMPGSPSGGPPGRRPEGSRVLNRNTLGIAAAIALVAGYLGVAAAAHLSPFPAKTVATPPSQSPSTGTSTGASTGTSTGASTGTSPDGSPDASPDASPPSDYQILLTKIPSAVRAQSGCPNAGTSVGATAVSQCADLHGLGAGTIMYYLFPSPAALATGFSNLLKQKAKFRKSRECTTNNKFTDFLVNCESDFTSATPNIKGSIAEYTNRHNQPIIVTSDSRQNVMVVMVGTNDPDLLAYWRQLKWVVP
jgi:hypothetical protein